MSSGEWTFGELVEASILDVGDGYRAKNSELGGTGPIFLRSAYLQDQGFLAEMPERFLVDDASRFGAKAARLGDVVITTKGNSTGRVGVIRPEQVGAVYSPHLSYWRSLDASKIDQRFLCYWSRSPAFRSQLAGMAYSTDMAPYLSLRDQKRLRITLPEIAVQRSVGELLSALDDKIELNRRMNETLEAMARAIFRDWFVDFGPTRRQVEGATDPVTIMGGLVQDAERAQALADLFPTELSDDGLPRSWARGHLRDVLELRYGKSLPKGERRDGAVPVYGSGGIGGFHSEALVQGPSIIVGRKGTVGSLYWEDGGFFPIDTVFYVTSKNPMTYCYYLLQTLGLETMNTDAAVPGLNRENAYRLDVGIPDKDILTEFANLVDLLRSKISANTVENRTLVATRDLLLPKLMSGEIRLREAEERLEAAQ